MQKHSIGTPIVLALKISTPAMALYLCPNLGHLKPKPSPHYIPTQAPKRHQPRIAIHPPTANRYSPPTTNQTQAQVSDVLRQDWEHRCVKLAGREHHKLAHSRQEPPQGIHSDRAQAVAEAQGQLPKLTQLQVQQEAQADVIQVGGASQVEFLQRHASKIFERSHCQPALWGGKKCRKDNSRRETLGDID